MFPLAVYYWVYIVDAAPGPACAHAACRAVVHGPHGAGLGAIMRVCGGCMRVYAGYVYGYAGTGAVYMRVRTPVQCGKLLVKQTPVR